MKIGVIEVAQAALAAAFAESHHPAFATNDDTRATLAGKDVKP